MRKFKAIFFVAILLLLSQQAFAEGEKPQQINSDLLKQTVVTAYMQENIAKGKNLLYCSTFQIAWNELIDDIIKEPLMLQGNPIISQMLNARLAGKEDISEKYYLAMAGYKNDGIVEKVKKALKEKFNETPGIDISLQNPTDILAYAFLLKDLKFENEFERLAELIMFNGAWVEGFGIEKYSLDNAHIKLGSQVSIIDYKDHNDFIISLKSTEPKDEIILAKVLPQTTLLETINSVLSRINNSQSSSFAKDETLQIPKIDFDLLHEYLDLEGKIVLNRNFLKDKNSPNYFIGKAVQLIRFRLNEKGALLRSEAAISMVVGMMMPENKPRHFIFDKPFLICLKEKGTKYPYFAMWVDNAELLLKK